MRVDVCPSYAAKPRSRLLSLALMYLLRKCAEVSITALADGIGLDAKCFLDVVDVRDVVQTELLLQAISVAVCGSGVEGKGVGGDSGGLAVGNNTSTRDVNIESQRPPRRQDQVKEVSSSLLRVCSYPQPHAQPEALSESVSGNFSVSTSEFTSTSTSPSPSTSPESNQKNVAFGAHTDTTMLTLGLVSDIPGLELYDRNAEGGGRWVEVERECANSLAAHRLRSRLDSLALGEVDTADSSNGSTGDASNDSDDSIGDNRGNRETLTAIVFTGEILQVR